MEKELDLTKQLLKALAEEEMYEDDEYEEDELDLPVVPVDLQEVSFLSYDKEEFSEGIKSVSKLAGQFTGLKNVGIKDDDIMALLGLIYETEMMPTTMEHNLSIAKIQSVSMEKATI